MLSLSRTEGSGSPVSPSSVLLDVSGGLILSEDAKLRLCSHLRRENMKQKDCLRQARQNIIHRSYEKMTNVLKIRNPGAVGFCSFPPVLSNFKQL